MPPAQLLSPASALACASPVANAHGETVSADTFTAKPAPWMSEPVGRVDDSILNHTAGRVPSTAYGPIQSGVYPTPFAPESLSASGSLLE